MNRSIANQVKRSRITSAIGYIVRLFHWEPREFKDPAMLVCDEQTGAWELVEVGSRRARRLGVAVGPHVHEVDRADFEVTSGGLDELLDLAEVQLKKDIEGKAVAGLSFCNRPVRKKNMCWAELEDMNVVSSACPLRARPGHLTCMLHADYEEAARALLSASLKPPRVKG